MMKVRIVLLLLAANVALAVVLPSRRARYRRSGVTVVPVKGGEITRRLGAGRAGDGVGVRVRVGAQTWRRVGWMETRQEEPQSRN